MRILALLLVSACSTAPQVAQTTPIMTPSPTATPSAAPASVPAPLDAPAHWGAITALRTVNGERQFIGVTGEDPLRNNAGTATSRYMTVDGLEYAVHWDDAAKYGLLQVGDTVTIYPTRDRVCFSLEDCRRLVHIYPSDHFLPPLDLGP
jgi:hypothetical protein